MRLPRLQALAIAVLLSACGAASSGPGSTDPTMAPPVVTVPAADGPVTGVGTVIEKPGRPPELCLGPVAESWPPQCEGTPLSGWDWAQHPPEQQTEPGGPLTRWGTYAVTGTFDGVTLTVSGAVPLARYHTMAGPTPTPVTPPDLDAGEWDAVLGAVRAAPGLLSAERADPGPVQLAVVHDDGSVQAWADASFGVGAVVVTSALR
ncbi:MAG TPA: hypothetical protein VLQ78_00910 [Ornithinibacter sp.]|nr:hypothetical protein [Ornithinibacter sp.]